MQFQTLAIVWPKLTSLRSFTPIASSNDLYNSANKLIYQHTEAFVWAVFGLLLLALFIISSAELMRFLITLIVFAIIVAAGLYYLGYVHTNP